MCIRDRPAGSLLGDQLPHTGNFESGFLYNIGDFCDIAVVRLRQGCAHNARAGNADVNFAVWFAGAVKCAGHERVVFRKMCIRDRR